MRELAHGFRAYIEHVQFLRHDLLAGSRRSNGGGLVMVKAGRAPGAVLLIAGVLWACVGCGGAGGAAASVTEGQLLGTWSAGSGGQMTLSADHMFTAIGLERTVPDGDCNSTLMRGTWEFFVPMPGDSSGHSHVTDASATQGQSFGVIFGSGQSPVCSGLTGEIQRDAAGLDICLVEDGDEACADDEILRHQ